MSETRYYGSWFIGDAETPADEYDDTDPTPDAQLFAYADEAETVDEVDAAITALKARVALAALERAVVEAHVAAMVELQKPMKETLPLRERVELIRKADVAVEALIAARLAGQPG